MDILGIRFYKIILGNSKVQQARESITGFVLKFTDVEVEAQKW